MEILNPALKDRLWHKMRADLAQYVPHDMPADRLLCPACARWLPYEKFSIEHVIPQQALADDPPEIKAKLTTNQRTPITLLSTAPLKIKVKGEDVPRDAYGGGCNSWKGKVFDSYIRPVLNRRVITGKAQISQRSTIALLAAAHLAMVERFGYQPALTESGLLLRQQFFSPGHYVLGMPIMSQAVLMGDVPPPTAENLPYWRGPSFRFGDGRCYVGFRNVSLMLPCSRDPNIPIASSLRFQPSKYILRPDLRTAFV